MSFPRRNSKPTRRDGAGKERNSGRSGRKSSGEGKSSFFEEKRSSDGRRVFSSKGSSGKRSFTKKSDDGRDDFRPKKSSRNYSDSTRSGEDGFEKKKFKGSSFKSKEGGFSRNREEGFSKKREGGFSRDREEGFSKKREGGFSRNREEGFSKKREGGFSRNREEGFSKKREGGFSRNREEGFTKKREGGYGKSEERSYPRKRENFNKKKDDDFSDFEEKDFTKRKSAGSGWKENKEESNYRGSRKSSEHRSYSRDEDSGKKNIFDKKSAGREGKSFDRKKRPERTFKEKKPSDSKYSEKRKEDDGLVRLNKFIANAGICSRREADQLIEAGSITVNGKIITQLGFRVSPDDQIAYGGTPIKKEKLVYVVLNKPKDFITTTDDPEGRKTVLDLVKNAGRERIYPVGRLDRNTTGVLMLTNDGELAGKLTHPRYEIQKIYHVTLDKNVKREDLQAICNGIELEDGITKADEADYAEGGTKREIGIRLHSGKNRIVRRLFEKLGYEVIRLDRVNFAGLTKKDLPRGKWRFLTQKEVSFLKMMK